MAIKQCLQQLANNPSSYSSFSSNYTAMEPLIDEPIQGVTSTKIDNLSTTRLPQFGQRANNFHDEDRSRGPATGKEG